jgi:hypothetical protein
MSVPFAPIEIHTLATQVDEGMTRERMLAALSAFFGGLALLLATIGVYGTLGYLVAQRRIEFGIRMALGATPRSILTLVMRNVVTLLIGGVVTGIGLSLATSRLLERAAIRHRGTRPRNHRDERSPDSRCVAGGWSLGGPPRDESLTRWWLCVRSEVTRYAPAVLQLRKRPHSARRAVEGSTQLARRAGK